MKMFEPRKDYPYATNTFYKGGLCCPIKYVYNCILCLPTTVYAKDFFGSNELECDTNPNFENPSYRGKLVSMVSQ